MVPLSHPGSRIATQGLYVPAMRRFALPLAIAAAVLPRLAPPALAQSAITDADVRALVTRQAAALNAGDLASYFATFAPQAVFTQQALGSDNQITPYGSSTLPQARTQLGKTLARTTVDETVTVRRVVVDPTGRGAALSAAVETRVGADGRVRRSCAERLSTFGRIGGRLRTLQQTDTLVRCRRAG